MFERSIVATIRKRLQEPRRFIQIVAGPRQTGKTTAVMQALRTLDLPSVRVSGDGPGGGTARWLAGEWEQARLLARREGAAILFVDEAQKVAGWSEVIKAAWDADTWDGVDLRVVVSGSSTLLLRRGMSESLKGRFELVTSTQWTLPEMGAAFGFTLDDYLAHGGYPGAASLAGDEARWLSYLRDSIVEATISNDVLQLENVRKPALLRRLYELGAWHSGQEVSYKKLLGQLDDRGNTDTIAHYLDLLDAAGMVCGLQKYDRDALRARRSSPKLMVYDPALMNAAWGEEAERLRSDPAARGRLVESAVGAYLLARAQEGDLGVSWWRDRDDEVDFVVRRGQAVTAIEVKSGATGGHRGMEAFLRRVPGARPLVVGGDANPLEDFLSGRIPLFE